MTLASVIITVSALAALDVRVHVISHWALAHGSEPDANAFWLMSETQF